MNENKSKIDYGILIPPITIVLIFSVFVFLNKETCITFMNNTFSFLTDKLGFVYIGLTVLSFAIALYFIFGPLAKKRIGNTKPEFSTFAWLGMVFTSCSSAALLIWATFEGYYYITSPPYGIEPMSVSAFEFANPFVMFHWGPIPYAVYSVLGVVFGYYMFNRNMDTTRPSVGCYDLLGEKRTYGIWGKVIDIVFLVALVAGIGTTLGLATPLIAALINKLFGIEHTIITDILILISWTILISVSVYTGIKKGIQTLSNIRVYMFFSIIVIILLLGPTSFIINYFIDSMGIMIQNTPRMLLHTDSIRQSGFPQAWTIFYYAWYVSLAIEFGIFLARISKGRTIREYTIGTLLAAGLGNWLVIGVFGGASINIFKNNMSSIQAVYEQSGMSAAIVEIWSQFPLGMILIAALLIVAFISTGTFMNSFAYTMSIVCSKNLDKDEEPSKKLRVLWAIILGVFAMAILSMDSLSIIQTSSMVGSFPMVFIFIMLFISFFKGVKKSWYEDEDEDEEKNEL